MQSRVFAFDKDKKKIVLSDVEYFNEGRAREIIAERKVIKIETMRKMRKENLRKLIRSMS